MGRRTWIALGVLALAGLLVWIADLAIRESQARSALQERQDATASTECVAEKLGEPASMDAATAESILQLADQRWQQIRDYRCTIESKNRLNSELQSNTLEVAFKRPGMHRHQIVKGRNQGTLLTVDRQGSVRARPGGVLGVLVVPMKRDDPRLRDGRGLPFYESDWGSEIRRWQEAASASATLRRLDDAQSDDAPCWVLELTSPSREVQQLWIDQRSRLPARIITRRGGELLRDARYSNIVLNTDPDDSYFHLK